MANSVEAFPGGLGDNSGFQGEKGSSPCPCGATRCNCRGVPSSSTPASTSPSVSTVSTPILASASTSVSTMDSDVTLNSSEIKATLIIQKYYHSYRLRKAINELRESDPWFFMWKFTGRKSEEEEDDLMDIDDDSNDEDDEDEYDENEKRSSASASSATSTASDDSRLPTELQFSTLQAKFRDPVFFGRICNILELLGSARTASKCHAKMMLMAFMLNHHRSLVGAAAAASAIVTTTASAGVVSENNSLAHQGTSSMVEKEPCSMAPMPSVTSIPASPTPAVVPATALTSLEKEVFAKTTSPSPQQDQHELSSHGLLETDSAHHILEKNQCAKICSAQCSKSLLKQIAQLGSGFINVCQKPTCWFRRMEFMVAYSKYAKSFLDWKSKDAVGLIKHQVGLFVDAFSTMNDMNQYVKNGQLSLEHCQASLHRLKRLSEYHFLQISRLLGSSKQAKELVQKELGKRRFLKELSRRLQKKKLVLVEWESANGISVKNQVRMASLQSFIEKSPCPPRVGSRDEKYDSNIMMLWHGKYYKRLNTVKRILRERFDSANQSTWMPQLVGYLQTILSEVIIDDKDELAEFLKPLDTEFLSQQCAFNNCDPKEYLKYFLGVMKSHCSPNRYGRICQIFTLLQQQIQLEQQQQLQSMPHQKQKQNGLSLELILDIVDILDDMRVDITQMGLTALTTPMLGEDVKKNELVALVNDITANRGTGISNLEKWVELASTDSLGLISELMTGRSRTGNSVISSSSCENRDFSPLPLSKIEMLTVYFASFLANFPDSNRLDMVPETFSMLRLPILHTQILIRDAVMTFSIVQFTLSVSRDDTRLSHLKSLILAVLREDSRLNKLEIVSRICRVIDYERPTLNSSEKTLVHGLVSRLFRDSSIPSASANQDPLWAVPRLALERIRRCIEYKLLPQRDVIDESQRSLANFDCELKQITQYATSIWKSSLGVYKPIYQTLIHSKHLWRSEVSSTTE